MAAVDLCWAVNGLSVYAGKMMWSNDHMIAKATAFSKNSYNYARNYASNITNLIVLALACDCIPAAPIMHIALCKKWGRSQWHRPEVCSVCEVTKQESNL